MLVCSKAKFKSKEVIILKKKVSESSRCINLDGDKDKENRDGMEFELGRDKYIDDDGTAALKTSGIDMAKLGGGRLLIPLSGTYVVDGEQAREEGVIEERDVNLKEDMLITIENNEQINVMEMTEKEQSTEENMRSYKRNLGIMALQMWL
ncbi:Hypothetical predicted protein [Olea europaea subsp. europaea]|uniref:Uncharacterized protein n=1 Tax=Olea europaea subsp. europaea TaxID=158383 RepID=A0A8S0RKB3_OLEEU|nr:Hypothetical predicted protein [Olea europaea subsp. europaea]